MHTMVNSGVTVNHAVVALTSIMMTWNSTRSATVPLDFTSSASPSFLPAPVSAALADL